MFVFLILTVFAVILSYDFEKEPTIVVKSLNSSENIFCSDGAKDKECAKTRPYFCDNGELIENCRVCGCNNDFYCNNLTCTNCKENWICSEWLECTNEKEKRSCFDINNCGTSLKKPEIERTC